MHCTEAHSQGRLHLAGRIRRNVITIGWLASTGAIALVGCQVAPRTGGARGVDAATAAPPTFSIGDSVEGRPIECQVFGSGPDVVLILGSIHGNEPAGAVLVRRLAAALQHQPSLLAGRTVVLVPVANPDGLAHGTRTNARGVDLNRNFPADNWSSRGQHGSSALCEPESRALHALIEARHPTRIVSVHQPLTCIDYDGPARDLAFVMSEAGGLPVRRLGGRPGSLGSYAGHTLKIPIITVELPRRSPAPPDELLWSQYGRMMLAAVCYPHAAPGPESPVADRRESGQPTAEGE